MTHLHALGGDVELVDVRERQPIVVRTNYYPAWRAVDEGRDVPLFSDRGLLAFAAPRTGSYTVRLEYPRYRGVSLVALAALGLGLVLLSRWPRAARQ